MSEEDNSKDNSSKPQEILCFVVVQGKGFGKPHLIQKKTNNEMTNQEGSGNNNLKL
jgi:hypothetical protein